MVCCGHSYGIDDFGNSRQRRRYVLKSPFHSKIKTLDEIKSLVGNYPRKHKVAMCHGVFDIVHPGHIRHLIFAKEHADILIASVTADQHIKKANIRPHVPEQLRAENLAAFEMVDYVLIDANPTAGSNIRALQPDYFAKGYEYRKETNPQTLEEINALKSYGGEILFTPGDLVYSSSALIESAPPNISIDTLLLAMRAEGIGFDDLRNVLGQFDGIEVHVVGDTIVDTLTQTNLIGGLSKTPTFSVQVQSRENYVGGAAIVAKHLRAAGASVTFSTILGADDYATHVLDDLNGQGIAVLPFVDQTRPTTNKNAVVASSYRLLKIDTVDNRPISYKGLQTIKSGIADTQSDIVVFSDFRHGLFNRDTIPQLTNAIPSSAFKVADSQVASRWGNILDFKGFDLITPNEKEARFALGDQDSVIRPLAARLYEEAQCKSMILKLGSRGILAHKSKINGDHDFYFIGSFADQVIDAVGAGDALLAYASLAKKITNSDLIASILGSFAAAIECEYDGNIPVRLDDMHRKIDLIERKANLT